jgi:hypothetical protein
MLVTHFELQKHGNNILLQLLQTGKRRASGTYVGFLKALLMRPKSLAIKRLSEPFRGGDRALFSHSSRK